jgi:hypothetical protein
VSFAAAPSERRGLDVSYGFGADRVRGGTNRRVAVGSRWDAGTLSSRGSCVESHVTTGANPSGRRTRSWWAPRSSKPVRASISSWRVRFPSASATGSDLQVWLEVASFRGCDLRDQMAVVPDPCQMQMIKPAVLRESGARSASPRPIDAGAFSSPCVSAVRPRTTRGVAVADRRDRAWLVVITAPGGNYAVSASRSCRARAPATPAPSRLTVVSVRAV